MLAVFLAGDGRILFTYPDVTFLSQGDAVCWKGQEYAVMRKRFDVDAGVMELFLEEADDRHRMEP